MPDENTQENPAWRAYALMAWKELQTFGRETPVVDDQGKPVLDDDGKQRTKWKTFNIGDINEKTVAVADFLYAAEVGAEARRGASAVESDDSA